MTKHYLKITTPPTKTETIFWVPLQYTDSHFPISPFDSISSTCCNVNTKYQLSGVQCINPQSPFFKSSNQYFVIKFIYIPLLASHLLSRQPSTVINSNTDLKKGTVTVNGKTVIFRLEGNQKEILTEGQRLEQENVIKRNQTMLLYASLPEVLMWEGE